MKTAIFQGAGVAIITPMKEDGTINYEKMEELLEFQIRNHTDAVIVAGTTGESACLSDGEHEELIRFTCKTVNGRIPVIAGAGSNCTEHAQRLCRNAERAGADALLLVTPYYNKCSQRGLTAHYAACAKATGLPFILYNIPSRTGVNILPETYEELLKIPNVKAVKEASGNFSQIAKLESLYKERLDLYCGNDDQTVPSMALGAKGVISVLSNICPAEVSRMCSSFAAGDVQTSEELQMKYEELSEALFMDVNPIPVKAAMNLMGFEVGHCRLPLCDMEEKSMEKLAACLKKYGLM